MLVRMMEKDKGEKKAKQIKFLVQYLRKSQCGLVKCDLLKGGGWK